MRTSKFYVSSRFNAFSTAAADVVPFAFSYAPASAVALVMPSAGRRFIAKF